MKHQADKNRREQTFSVGDQVFLRLQPYIQSSVVRRANHKLSFKFFGPYAVLERVGQVAYKLLLPESRRVHPVFHVFRFKSFINACASVVIAQLLKCLSNGVEPTKRKPPGRTWSS
ncbi:hypothetical protein QYE76_059458 [Lolium multiflorum]|uniref:Tf2-1-like SH3-like domain-containing protein n=1 Tax=Lolium multiflorum TaxID=4521 RepID=A0AAD8RYR3_LOLMU|nr:hypothetical protein QYE76_059458 [Lolium multiflorum]